MIIPVFHLEERRGSRRGYVWSAAPWERVEARGLIASAIALAALTAAATAGGAVASGAIASHSANHGADVQAQATRDSTAAQLQAERDAAAESKRASEAQLAELQRQSGLSRADAEVNREGDYDQWSARENRVGSVGQMLGLPARQIPAFRPMASDPGPAGSGGGTAPNPANMPKQGEVNWSAPAAELTSQLSAYFKARGVPDSEVPYWVQQAGALNARGKQINDPGYADKRLAAAEIFGGGGGSAAGAPQTQPINRPYGSIGSITTPNPTAAAYVAPRVAMPGSIQYMSQ